MFGPGDVDFFDRVAPLYDRLMPGADPDVLADALAVATGPVRRVIDVGGGSGRASAALPAGLDADGPVVVDASAGMLTRARDRGFGAVRGDAARLPVHSNAVDAAVIVDALHHFPDVPGAFTELSRAIRPGGVVVVREFDPSHPLGRVLAVGERAIGMDSTFLAPDDLRRDLETTGFDATVLDRGFTYTVVGQVPDRGDADR
ncbi:methyltransferase domain-containing protein [Halopenitus sp. POP-27]|uniref:class I SAM-dependent methyltransferase n=1 Tax=Halopenitus sp. POP-27 TaxID=2994425 RepID=UPI0024698236|nr:methyltransferase domain-containing protein [Halopenitus sp. POP-27]